MFNISSVALANLIIHYVGNKLKGEQLSLSQESINVEEIVRELLIKYFFTAFKSEASYHFFHENELASNEIYANVSAVFENPAKFYEASVKIATHLYNTSSHQNIKSGEFYIAYFKDCIVGDEQLDAIGLFKSENKDTFLKVYPSGGVYTVTSDKGINIKKLDKGCLILNTDKEKGYRVYTLDNTNRANEAQFWRDDFLKLKPNKDDFAQTENFMKICKGFINDVYNAENNVERPEQIDLLNKTSDFLNDNQAFDLSKFQEEVMEGEENLIGAFDEYKDNYQENKGFVLDEEFEISKNAYKQFKKVFKSVLKLDKNFHVYIHGNRDNIIRGYDEKSGMNYYQLFFDTES